MNNKIVDLEEISTQIIENITDILDEFELEYEEYEDRISMSCPIHGGDNPEGMSILTKDVGNWRCFTHNCHEQGSSIINLIQLLLKINHKNDIPPSFQETLKWCATFLNIELLDIKEGNEGTKFIHLLKHVSKKPNTISSFFPRHLAIKDLKIPSDYFVKRGFSCEILKRFDIGTCDNSNRSMYQRAVTPCYDKEGKHAVGFLGRSVFEKCSCKYFHNPNDRCPLTGQEKKDGVKWKSNTGFNLEAYLYNLWNFDHKLNYAVLVEGAGDVWRLEEAGIRNSLALFGTKFTSSQKMIIETLPITLLIIATDNDKAGRKIRNSIRESCKKLVKIRDIETDIDTDIGDSSIDEIKQLFSV